MSRGDLQEPKWGAYARRRWDTADSPVAVNRHRKLTHHGLVKSVQRGLWIPRLDPPASFCTGSSLHADFASGWVMPARRSTSMICRHIGPGSATLGAILGSLPAFVSAQRTPSTGLRSRQWRSARTQAALHLRRRGPNAKRDSPRMGHWWRNNTWDRNAWARVEVSPHARRSRVDSTANDDFELGWTYCGRQQPSPSCDLQAI